MRAPRRRFWTTAGVRPEAGGFAVVLDDGTELERQPLFSTRATVLYPADHLVES